MSGLVKQRQQVRTNTVAGSVCRVDVPPVTFAMLWNNYVTGNPYDDPAYDNQCAIRLSATLHRVGIEMKSFSQSLVKPGAGKASLRRILLNGKATATRADEMASSLQLQPFCGLPAKPENVTGADWEAKVRGRTGVIAFKNYWGRSATEINPSGGHIDLWNGRRLTISSGEGLLGVIGRGLGLASAHIPHTGIGYSDLSKATEILFWEMQ